jgi:hypothetical protein
LANFVEEVDEVKHNKATSVKPTIKVKVMTKREVYHGRGAREKHKFCLRKSVYKCKV